MSEDVSLERSRQRAVLALARERARIVGELQECDEGMAQMADDIARHKGLEGTWGFVQDAAGNVVLRKIEPPTPDETAASQGA